jgi:formate dehydrogenase maturation protein FdhE
VDAENPSRFQELRRERLQLPPCPACRSMLVTVASRTPCMLYLRCRGCHTIWSVPKPGVDQLGE